MKYECAREERPSSYVLDKVLDQLPRGEAHYKEENSHMQQEIMELRAL